MEQNVTITYNKEKKIDKEKYITEQKRLRSKCGVQAPPMSALSTRKHLRKIAEQEGKKFYDGGSNNGDTGV
jgi:hypothetical protein